MHSSKLYNEYLKLKDSDRDTYYLFKCGLFYIFLDDDAKNVNKVTLLKLTNHASGVVKCGFPKEKLDDYLNVFKNIGINVKIIDNIDTFEDYSNKRLSKYLNKIRDIDLKDVTPMDAFNILVKLKELL